MPDAVQQSRVNCLAVLGPFSAYLAVISDPWQVFLGPRPSNGLDWISQISSRKYILGFVCYLGGELYHPLSGLKQTLSIWLGTQFSQPNPELGPLQA